MNQSAYLVMINVPPREWSMRVDDTKQTIGRGMDCECQVDLRYKSISRRHARLWFDDGFWLEDLASSFGTRVNGVDIPPHKLVLITEGDNLELGDIEFQLLSTEEYQRRYHAISDDSASSMYSVAPDRKQDSVDFSELTQTELEIVIWISRGLTTIEEIGTRTHRSPRTIHTHLNNIYKKLNVHSRHELIALLLRHDTRLS